MSGIHYLYTSYADAEDECVRRAGDTSGHYAVVECFDLLSGPGNFNGIVVTIDEADAMVEEYDGQREIIYDCDYTPATRGDQL